MEKTSVLVLIAEDEEEIRHVLQVTLEEGGFAVLTASSAEEAIAALDTKGDQVRALVTDVNLGTNITGWDVAKHARELRADVPIVYMTGGEGHEWASMGVPNSILVAKPFAPSQVLTAVSQLLNAGTSLST